MMKQNQDEKVLPQAKLSRVVVIGGGVVGAMIAYELSKIGGLAVTLLERNQPASGATGAALGIMMGVISHKYKGRAWRLRHSSLELYESLIPELEASTQIKIPYNRQGILKISDQAEEVEKWTELQEIRAKQQLKLEVWSPNQITDFCPQIDVSGNKIVAALYSPGDRQVHPTLLTQALVKGAQQQGVNCKWGVEVQELLLKGNYCQKLVTNRGNISADWVVISAGIGSTPLVKNPEIRPVLGQGIEIKLDKPLGKGEFQPVITGDDVHILSLGNGKYWIGATVEFESSDQALEADRAQLEKVKEKAIAFCPDLASGKIVKTWSGLRPRPEGKPAPVIEPWSEAQNVLLATGHYRNGVFLAPATAETVKDFLRTQGVF